MFDAWHDFYLVIGPSAAALIGLMFVVTTLTVGRDRSEVERGKHLYTSPIVWHLASVLAVSGLALAPTVTAHVYGLATMALALLGGAVGLRSAIGIVRNPHSPATWFDMFWYGSAPALCYVGMAVTAVGFLQGRGWAPSLAAADLMALLLISIHAEWDLVTFLAPIATPPGGKIEGGSSAGDAPSPNSTAER